MTIGEGKSEAAASVALFAFANQIYPLVNQHADSIRSYTSRSKTNSEKLAFLRHLDYKGKTGLEEICSEAAIAKRLNPQDPKCSYGEILPSQTF